MMKQPIVEIHGPAKRSRTDALRMLAPDARYVEGDVDGAVVLADGRQVAPFNAVMDLVGADSGFVAAACALDLKRIDDHLQSRTFMMGNSISDTDRVVLGLLHSHIATLNDADLYRYCCLARWFDHVLWAVPALPHVPIKTQLDVRPAKPEKKGKKVATSTATSSSDGVVMTTSSAIQDAAAFDIRIGRIVHVEEHQADPALYVEQIDLGESSGPRQIVSGLAKFVPPSDMIGRYVCVLVNISACEIKGVPSAGLVLCASNPSRTRVEPIRPRDGAAPGDRIMFPGVPVPSEGPPKVITPKRLHKLLKMLKTSSDTEPYAVCGDLPFMTKQGRVYASPDLANCPIK